MKLKMCNQTAQRHRPFKLAIGLGLLLAIARPCPVRLAAQASDRWVGTWATSSQLMDPEQLPPAPGFADTTVRQVLRVSIGGRTLRVRLSNEFGNAELALLDVRVARSAGGSAIHADSDRRVTFRGRASVRIPPGAPVVSDPLDFDLAPLTSLVVTIYLRGAPTDVTGHPGSRTTSFLQAGNVSTAVALPDSARIEHWYFLSGIDVLASSSAGALAVIGDSITDGRGSTTDANDRWPDNLARRLQAAAATSQAGVLNLGIGGNRLLSSGLGENALARLDRDVLAQPGVRWLIVFEGINDIGARSAARQKGQAFATADDIIFALEQIVARARTHHILVYGATIMPFEGFTYLDYYTPEGEAVRQKVNEWIRTSGRFDGVIDFDRATRDPERPSRLAAAVDGGDHLHPSAAGYRIMADAIDLALFTRIR